MCRTGTGCGCRALHVRSGFAATDVHDTILRDEFQNAKKPGSLEKAGLLKMRPKPPHAVWEGLTVVG
jgi:hypothetical protein